MCAAVVPSLRDSEKKWGNLSRRLRTAPGIYHPFGIRKGGTSCILLILDSSQRHAGMTRSSIVTRSAGVSPALNHAWMCEDPTEVWASLFPGREVCALLLCHPFGIRKSGTSCILLILDSSQRHAGMTRSSIVTRSAGVSPALDHAWMCEDPTEVHASLFPGREVCALLLCHPFGILRRSGAISRGAYARRQVYIIPLGF